MRNWDDCSHFHISDSKKYHLRALFFPKNIEIFLTSHNKDKKITVTHGTPFYFK